MREFPERALPQFAIFKKFSTPAKVQDFLNTLPTNFEEGGQTYRSPLSTLEHGTAHCMEGAMLAAAIFWYHGASPLLLDLKTVKGDDDHVVALFKKHGLWGAVSKTNHPVLRYRDPIYRSVRELALSYFNEYFLDSGIKTLRQYSRPFSLLRYENTWLTEKEQAWNIAIDLDESPHYSLVPKAGVRHLRRADQIEIESTKATEWQRRK